MQETRTHLNPPLLTTSNIQSVAHRQQSIPPPEHRFISSTFSIPTLSQLKAQYSLSPGLWQKTPDCLCLWSSLIILTETNQLSSRYELARHVTSFKTQLLTSSQLPLARLTCASWISAFLPCSLTSLISDLMHTLLQLVKSYQIQEALLDYIFGTSLASTHLKVFTFHSPPLTRFLEGKDRIIIISTSIVTA